MKHEVEKELPRSTTDPAKEISKESQSTTSTSGEEAEVPTRLQPELGSNTDKWTKIDLLFKAEPVSLELLHGADDQPTGEVTTASLTKFSLNKTSIKLRVVSDGAMESELLIQVLHNSRYATARNEQIQGGYVPYQL